MMASAEDLRIRLVINYSVSDTDAANLGQVWRPQDTLSGHLELSNSISCPSGKVYLYLEGVSRNWISVTKDGDLNPTIRKAERKFLTQAQSILPGSISRKDLSTGEVIYEAPFHFIIPKALASGNPNLPEQCLQLPPSLDLGRSIIEESTGKRFAQPSIVYYLRATVDLDEQEHAGRKQIETSVPLIVMPHTKEFPPTETKDFPSEFKEQESKGLRKSFISGKLGVMKVSITEPPALTYATSAVCSTTEALLNLEFESDGTNQTLQALKNMRFTILPLIRIKTFYSLDIFPVLPSQGLLTLRGSARLRDEMVKLKARTLEDVVWSYAYSVVDENNEGRYITDSLPKGKWTAIIRLPITMHYRLLPTFCSSIVARLYSVLLRVKVAGVRAKSFDLEIPLQVVHAAPQNEFADSAEFIRDDEAFEVYRTPSQISWFGNDSMEYEESPPDYYL